MKKIISLMISCLLVMSAMLFAFAPQADAALFNIGDIGDEHLSGVHQP